MRSLPPFRGVTTPPMPSPSGLRRMRSNISVNRADRAGQNSDHANDNDGGGPSWVASIVNGIGHSATCDNNKGYWKNTAIVITWDDWCGWYDHEPPMILPFPEGGYQYGFRVPLIRSE